VPIVPSLAKLKKGAREASSEWYGLYALANGIACDIAAMSHEQIWEEQEAQGAKNMSTCGHLQKFIQDGLLAAMKDEVVLNDALAYAQKSGCG